MHVRITRKAKNIMQSACGCTSDWYIEPLRTTPRSQDPLMGWTCANDPLSSLHGRLRFETLEQAEAFARARGWIATTIQPNAKISRPRSYLDNFNTDRRRTGR